ncbi:MAG: AMP-binding protein, partial [Eubacterium sp.]|nr:AMP-binding protein [Eubacterium sp.]
MFDFVREVKEWSLRTPDRIAVVAGGGTEKTTYRQLDELSGKVYRYLKQKGIGKEDFVAVSLFRSAAPFIAMLGIMKAGAAFVLLEKDTPSARLEFILKDCNCRMLITPEIWNEIMETDSLPGYEDRDEHDAAFAVYTSGSTGNPKGVVHEAGNIGRICESYCTDGEPIFLPGDVFALLAPISFVPSVVFSFLTLTVGAELHVISLAVVKNPSALEKCLFDEKITIFFAAPTLYRSIRSISPTVRTIILGSETVSGIWNPDHKCLCLYSSSELAFCFASFYLDQAYERTPIGRTHAWCFYKIMNENGREAAEGEDGELWVENPFVRGYLNLPDQTEKVFDKNHMYHTGDIVRQLPDGKLVVLGRNDDMIKINGNRVETGEVESAVKKVLGIDRCVVKGFTEEKSAYLCAYYTDDIEIDYGKTREALQELVPDYMIPSHFIRLEEFPKNVNGKMDRRSLKAPVFLSYRSEYAAPETETEAALCGAYEEVLHMDHIGIDDDFIALGGDSLRLMQLSSLFPDPGFTAKHVFDLRTPRKLAEFLESQGEKEPDLKRSVRSDGDWPLSKAQIGIFLECLKHNGKAIYNNPLLAELPKDIDLPRLCKAIENTVAAHPALFTAFFVNAEGDPRQKPDTRTYSQRIQTLTGETFERQKTGLVKPFDILNDRLFRIELFQTEDTAYLFMDFHHLVIDGTSFGILMADLDSSYRGKEIPGETCTVFDLAGEEDADRRSPIYETARAWHEEYLKGADTDNLPRGDRNGRGESRKKCRYSFALSVRELSKLCGEQNTSVNVLSNAAFGYLLSVCLRKEDVSFATVFNGRTDLKQNRTVGMMVRTIPMRCRIHDNSDIRTYLNETKEHLLGAMANDLYSFDEVSASYGLTSEVLFACQDKINVRPALDGKLLKHIPLAYQATESSFSVELWLPEDGRVYVSAEYDDSRYSENLIRRMLSLYERILTGLLKRERLDEIALVSDTEQKALLKLGTGRQEPYDPEETF